ncbi:MAG: OmpA family protein [Maribacter sp.]
MKNLSPAVKLVLSFLFVFAFSTNAHGQFLKKLGKRAEKAAERAVERRVEQETQEKTDQVLDSILEPGSKKKEKPKASSKGSKNEPQSDRQSKDSGTSDTPTSDNTPKSMQIYSKFDFVPGDKLLLTDDFSNEFVGDFPSKWNTNGSGELVQIGNSSNKWLKILPGYNTKYIPDVTDFPEEFTLEFDVTTEGLNNKTSSQAYFAIIVADNNSFEKAKNYGMVEYPLCQFIDPGTIVENNLNGKREIRNTIKVDLRKIITKKHHISIAVNKQRYRLWINEQKLVDVPRLLPANVQMQSIKLGLRGTDAEGIYLSNFKIAKGGIDLRRQLLAEGKISTNGIGFESGSANIQPQSMGIIRQMFQVLQQEKTMQLRIVGHTDADGGAEANLSLSEKRAKAIKNTLVSVYGVSADRLQTEGKGESQPIGDNSTRDGKAQNRRVEFIKL